MGKTELLCKVECHYLCDDIFLVEEVLDLRVIAFPWSEDEHDVGLLLDLSLVLRFQALQIVHLGNFEPLWFLHFDSESLAALHQVFKHISSFIVVSFLIGESPFSLL